MMGEDRHTESTQKTGYVKFLPDYQTENLLKKSRTTSQDVYFNNLNKSATQES
jgi:hypothetical protein